MKKILMILIVIVATIGMNMSVKADTSVPSNCYIDFSGNVVCDEPTPEGCHINEETRELECEKQPRNCEFKDRC